MTQSIGIYIYHDVEVLDFSGPFEVFSTASRVHSSLNPDKPALFNVFTLAEIKQPVQCRGDLIVEPHYSLSKHPLIDVLIIPGGIYAAEMQKSGVIEWIRITAKKAIITASVCTGAFLLAQAGLLTEKKATTHWEDINDFRSMFPKINILSEQRWVDVGDVVTSAGISAGIDMCLHLVTRLESEMLALKTAKQMEYDWRITGGI